MTGGISWTRHASPARAGDSLPAPEPSTKPVNPKDGIGSTKLPLHLWPMSATAHGCLALLDGMLKYGRLNWRGTEVRASVYLAACGRHLGEWLEGQNEGRQERSAPAGTRPGL